MRTWREIYSGYRYGRRTGDWSRHFGPDGVDLRVAIACMGASVKDWRDAYTPHQLLMARLWRARGYRMWGTEEDFGGVRVRWEYRKLGDHYVFTLPEWLVIAGWRYHETRPHRKHRPKLP